ncbi:ABC transporter permease subunit [Streptacidiphilus carbonis]|uniref:ABC transporter permease subunit n=1 Tax=Streptacidiphilus carbonis TaxID=105422 RepID=UPI0005AB8215|nr:ABC transporter permease subunit [Streptacidiphilus carbonis]
MIWLTWRQFRIQALAAATVLAAAAIYLLVTGQQMHHAYTVAEAACRQPRSQCGLILQQFQQAHNGPLQLFQLLLLAMPPLIGVFWGAPLIASELERGTHRMTWNQSITPMRWLTVKLTAVGLAAIATSGSFSLLVTWWASPLDHVADSRFGAVTFATRNIVPLGYAAFAFALATALGLAFRRVLLAMALTLAVFVGLQVLFATQVRPNLLPSTVSQPAVNASLLSQAGGIGSDGGNDLLTVFNPGPAGAWIQSGGNVLNSQGQQISFSEVSTCMNGGPQGMAAIGDCLAPHDLHIDLTYQPGSNYWPLQWYETGIYLALAALFSGACFWRIRRHHD